MVYVAGCVACLILIWKDGVQLAGQCSKFWKKIGRRLARKIEKKLDSVTAMKYDRSIVPCFRI